MGKGLRGVDGYSEEMGGRNMVTYSDDSNVCCRLEREGVKGVLDAFEEFCQISGQVVNVSKTKVFLAIPQTRRRLGCYRNWG